PEGVVFHYEGMKHSGSTYLKFTPEWFFDYYALNRFQDCQVHVLAYHDYFGPYSVVEWNAYYQEGETWSPAPSIRLSGEAMVVVVAQNSVEAEVGRMPIESNYRGDSDEYIRASRHFAMSLRRGAFRENLLSCKPEERSDSHGVVAEVAHKGVGSRLGSGLGYVCQWAARHFDAASSAGVAGEAGMKAGASAQMPPYEPHTLAHEFVGEVL